MNNSDRLTRADRQALLVLLVRGGTPRPLSLSIFKNTLKNFLCTTAWTIQSLSNINAKCTFNNNSTKQSEQNCRNIKIAHVRTRSCADFEEHAFKNT